MVLLEWNGQAKKIKKELLNDAMGADVSKFLGEIARPPAYYITSMVLPMTTSTALKAEASQINETRKTAMSEPSACV